MAIESARTLATFTALTVLLATGCTIDEDPDPLTDATPPADNAPADTARADQLELSGPKVDIEGLFLDTEARCVEPGVVTLGQGLLEPPTFAPRCLVNEATGARYLVRPGSRAVLEGHTPCDLGEAFGWRMCDQTCPDSYPDRQIRLEFGCGDQFVEPQCADFNTSDVYTSYWHPETHAWVGSGNVVLSPPWIEGGPDFPAFLDGYERTSEPCPEGE